MKSYQSHLTETQSFGENLPKNYRPKMRSSAIFPLIKKKYKIESIYTFMGYWLRKRNIKVVTALITIRDSIGNKIKVISYEINCYKSYVFSANDFLLDRYENFIGSVEIEIFSAVDMVFPYPAITFALKSTNGITFVHTSGRIYNDIDDLNSNSEIIVAETGFDIYTGKNYSPFFSFINGPLKIEKSYYELEFIDENSNHYSQKRQIKNVAPYGLVLIELFNKKFKLSKKFKEKKLTVKIKHNFKGFFPRFICGNIYKNFLDISLTHSYYDSSTVNDKKSTYQNPSKKKYYDSTFSIPFDRYFDEIELAIYPNFSIAQTTLSFELYNLDGNFVDISNTKFKISNAKQNLIYIPMSKMFDTKFKSLDKGMIKVIVDGGGKVPSRMKFGLNFLKSNKENNLPSNICFNANVANDKLIKKPGTFKWCPIFSAISQKIYIHNTSFVRRGFGTANLKIELCREKDNKKLKWSLKLKDNATLELIERKFKKIDLFLENSIGWITIQSSNPFISGYYITDFGKGVIGADHIF